MKQEVSKVIELEFGIIFFNNRSRTIKNTNCIGGLVVKLAVAIRQNKFRLAPGSIPGRCKRTNFWNIERLELQLSIYPPAKWKGLLDALDRLPVNVAER